jgi:hypothetical protein
MVTQMPETQQEELFVEIEQEPEAPAVETTVEKVAEGGPPKAADPADELRAQLAEFERRTEEHKAQLAEARRRADEHQRRAETSQREATLSQAQIIDAQLNGVLVGLAAAEADANAAEAEIAHAMERADYAAVAKAQRKMAQAETRIDRLALAKEHWETQKRTPARPQRREQPQPQGWDASATIERLEGKSRDWAMEHREFFSSPEQYQKVERAHLHAVAEDIEPNTPEYFEHIERRLGLKKGPDRERDGSGKFVAGEKPKRSSSPPAAPVNASGRGSNGVQGNTVTLTPGEARAAQDGTHVWNYDDPNGRFKKGQAIGVEEFARRKRELTRQGAYDRSYSE